MKISESVEMICKKGFSSVMQLETELLQTHSGSLFPSISKFSSLTARICPNIAKGSGQLHLNTRAIKPFGNSPRSNGAGHRSESPYRKPTFSRRGCLHERIHDAKPIRRYPVPDSAGRVRISLVMWGCSRVTPAPETS